MSSDLPLYMRTQPEEFYQNFIEERKIFSEFVQTHIQKGINQILQQINTYIELNYPDKVALWVGGSRSWYNSFNCFYKTTTVNTLEYNAVLPGNYDIFVMCNDAAAHADILCKIKELVEDYMSQFKTNDLGNHYQLSKKYSNIDKECNIKYPDALVGCTLFPCQSILMKIKSKQTRKYSTRKALSSEFDSMESSNNTLSSPFTETRSVFSLDQFDEITGVVKRSVSDNENLPKIVKDKLLLYIESFVVPSVNVRLFKDKLLFSFCPADAIDMNIKHLNPMGLLLMAEFISAPRKHKGLNVDEFRKRLLLKTVKDQNNTTPFDAYKETLDVYYGVFGNSAYIDKYLVHTLIKEMMTLSNINVKDDMDMLFIRHVRPYVNSYLRDLELTLMKAYGEDAFIALVGGDAMRRYDINISHTSDFDTKLYVNTKRVKINKLEELMIYDLSSFITFLNRQRHTFLPQEHISYNINNEMNFTVQPVLLTPEAQFRLRYIKKSVDFPINLFSLDFRYKIIVTYRSAKLDMYLDVPFVDIAIINNGQVKNKYTKSDVVDIEHSPVVPVVTLDFLLNDLHKTYTTPSLSAARYWNDKVSKDIHRFRILQGVRNSPSIEDDNTMEMDNYGEIMLNEVVDDQEWDKINNDRNLVEGDAYAQAFINIMNSSKRQKYKMNFSNYTEDTEFDSSDQDASLLTQDTAMDVE